MTYPPNSVNAFATLHVAIGTSSIMCVTSLMLMGKAEDGQATMVLRDEENPYFPWQCLYIQRYFPKHAVSANIRILC